jgi:hypothetical protein
MPSPVIVECSFLIPICRDAILSDGQAHKAETWEQLFSELFARFGGRTVAPGLYAGAYRDPGTGAEVGDESRRIIVAIEESALDGLRQLLAEACGWFHQKCIYLSIAGQVEFITKP